ncbi:MAG TPA: hypothetical protein VH583_20615 [Vicinamibacterales bacterium]|jgi:hypothetical protein
MARRLRAGDAETVMGDFVFSVLLYPMAIIAVWYAAIHLATVVRLMSVGRAGATSAPVALEISRVRERQRSAPKEILRGLSGRERFRLAEEKGFSCA